MFNLVIWVGIILGTVFLYSSRGIILESRFVANLVPSYGYKADKQTFIFKRSNDGHFYINIYVNGKSIKFLVDTGASDVAISRSDAAKIGINLNSLKYTKIYQTANGVIYAAPIVLENINIKGIILHNIRASISSSDALGVSLLGMSFLQNFQFSISDDSLVLHFN